MFSLTVGHDVSIERCAVGTVAVDTQQFQTGPASQSVLLNDTVRLDCVSGYSAPPADIHWLHDGVMTTTGHHAVAEFGSRRDGGASGQRSASLTLEAASYEDRGFYECVAVNPMSGRTVHSRKAFVNVTGRHSTPFAIVANKIPNNRLCNITFKYRKQTQIFRFARLLRLVTKHVEYFITSKFELTRPVQFSLYNNFCAFFLTVYIVIK